MLIPVILISICFYVGLRLICWQVPVLFRETIKILKEASQENE